MFWRQDGVQRTLAISPCAALIGFCLWWGSHSLHRGGADFAAGRMEVRQQILGLSKASQGLSGGAVGEGLPWEWAHPACEPKCETQALLGAPRARWPGLVPMNVQPGARGRWGSPQNTNDAPAPATPLPSAFPGSLCPTPSCLAPSLLGLEAEPLARTVGTTARCLECLPWILVVEPRIACWGI